MVNILIYKIGSWNDPQIYIGFTASKFISPILHLQKQRYEKYKLGKSGYKYSKVFEVLKHKRSYIILIKRVDCEPNEIKTIVGNIKQEHAKHCINYCGYSANLSKIEFSKNKSDYAKAMYYQAKLEKNNLL